MASAQCTCVWYGVVMDEKHDIFLLGRTRQRRAFRILSVPVLLLYDEVYNNNTFFIPNGCRYWSTFEFLLPSACRVAPHFIDCCLYSGSKWWTEAYSPVTICDKKLSPRAAHIRSDCFTCFFACISEFVATNEKRP